MSRFVSRPSRDDAICAGPRRRSSRGNDGATDRAGRFDFSRAQDGDGLAARTIPGRGGRPCTCRRGVHIARQTWRKRSARGGRPYPRGASRDLEQPDPASERIRGKKRVKTSVSSSVRPRKRQLESQIYAGAAAQQTRAVHAAQHVMVAEATRGVETRARKRKRDLDAQAGVAIPGLSFDVVVSIVEKHLPDPADLAILRAVSKGMRDAVDATGRKVEDFGQYDAAERGYLSTLKCLRRRGVLKDERLLCAAAARSGQLEALKALRAENFGTSGRAADAANGGHLEVLKWARENGCPWDERTCRGAAECGHLEVLKWARDNGCPWDENTCESAARPPRGAEVGARERLPVGQEDVRGSGGVRPPRCAEVGARERLPVGRVDAPTRGFEGIRRGLSRRRETACALPTREPRRETRRDETMRIRLRALYDANFMRRQFLAKTRRATMTRRRRLRFGCPARASSFIAAITTRGP